MKQIRGFGYVGADVDEDPGYCEELDDVELEQGFGAEMVDPYYLTVRDYSCTRCKRVLFKADVSLHGVIFIRCRHCKREVAIETTPLMRSIGFIKPIRKENVDNDRYRKARKKER